MIAFNLGARHRRYGWDAMCPDGWGLELWRKYMRGYQSTESEQN